MTCCGKVCRGKGLGGSGRVGEGFTVFDVVSWTRNDLRQRDDNSTFIALFSLSLSCEIRSFIFTKRIS